MNKTTFFLLTVTWALREEEKHRDIADDSRSNGARAPIPCLCTDTYIVLYVGAVKRNNALRSFDVDISAASIDDVASGKTKGSAGSHYIEGKIMILLSQMICQITSTYIYTLASVNKRPGSL